MYLTSSPRVLLPSSSRSPRWTICISRLSRFAYLVRRGRTRWPLRTAKS